MSVTMSNAVIDFIRAKQIDSFQKLHFLYRFHDPYE